MKLSLARLCLDCEDVHGESCCPVCGSEAFAYLTRWIAAREPRPPGSDAPAERGGAGGGRARALPRSGDRRPADPVEPPPRVEAYRQLLVADAVGPKAARLLRQGAVGLAAVSLVRWAWRKYLK
jgi:hypothetical protein